MDVVEKLQAEKAALLARGQKLLASANPEDIAEARSVVEQCKGLDAQIQTAREFAALSTPPPAGVDAIPFAGSTSTNGQPVNLGSTASPAVSMADTAVAPLPGTAQPVRRDFALPAMAARGNPRFVTTDGRPDAKLAYSIGRFLSATLGRNAASLQWCQDHGIAVRTEHGTPLTARNFAQTEGVNTAGGVLVFDEFERMIIDLKERYGVFRSNAQVIPMSSDTKLVPRRTGGVTAYYIGEGTTITDSTMTWDNTQLVAKKLATLVYVSNELNEDAFVSMGDTVANEIAWAFALAEDHAGFNGTGTNDTSTYDGATVYSGGITGVRTKISNLSGTIANIAGVQVGTGSASYSALTLADFHGLIGKLPEYAASQPDCAFYCSRTFWSTVMQRLMIASGGVTALEVANGQLTPMFLGYPVRVTQVMPKVAAASQLCCLFGSLRLAAKFGDRRMTTLEMSTHSAFASDQLAIRATQRYDINVHDVGNADATAANRIAGPIVALACGA